MGDCAVLTIGASRLRTSSSLAARTLLPSKWRRHSTSIPRCRPPPSWPPWGSIYAAAMWIVAVPRDQPQHAHTESLLGLWARRAGLFHEGARWCWRRT